MMREWIARGIIVLGLAAVISIPVIRTVRGFRRDRGTCPHG